MSCLVLLDPDVVIASQEAWVQGQSCYAIQNFHQLLMVLLCAVFVGPLILL